MSDPIDVKALDEYLKAGGSSDISLRYRELGREDVPPELDRRVLDEARAAVASGGGGRSRSWLQWSAPLALAASIMLVVTVVMESGVQNDVSFATQPTDEVLLKDTAQPPEQQPDAQFVQEPPAAIAPQAAPVAAPAAPPPIPEEVPEEVPKDVRADAKAMRDQSRANSPVATDTATLDSPAPELAAAAEQPTPALAGSVAPIAARKEVHSAPAEADSSDDDDLSPVSVTGSTRARRAGRTAGPRSTISSSTASSETRPSADEEAEQLDPQKWLEEIRELRRTGKASEADLAWRHFRKAYPEFPVADDDLARKQR